MKNESLKKIKENIKKDAENIPGPKGSSAFKKGIFCRVAIGDRKSRDCREFELKKFRDVANFIKQHYKKGKKIWISLLGFGREIKRKYIVR